MSNLADALVGDASGLRYLSHRRVFQCPANDVISLGLGFTQGRSGLSNLV